MKKLVIGIVIVILLSVGYLFVSDEKPMETNSTPSSSAVEPKPVTDAEVQTAGQYLEYSDSELAATEGTRILFFHAPWCPQCRSLEASIKSSTIPNGVTIFKVDYDSSQQLRQKYGVTIQTTLVKIDENGELISKFVAYDDPTFENLAQNLLP